MECPECFQAFDEKRRRPKALPCGHTACLECLARVDRCLVDQKGFESIPSELPDNQSVLSLMRSSITRSGPSLHLWCKNCSDEATENCVDEGHAVTSMKSHWHEQATQKLNLTDNKLDPQYLCTLLNNLDEDAAAKALEVLSGKAEAPGLDVFVQAGTGRWKSSLPVGEVMESDNGEIVKGMLLLMASESILPKDFVIPATPEEGNKPIVEDVDPDSEIDLTNISSCRDLESVMEEKEKLLSSDSLKKVKRVTGLYCDIDRKWSVKILQLLAPFVEEVHIYNFYREHLEVIQSMPELRWVVLEFWKDKIDKNSDYQLPTLQHISKVEFLWANLAYPDCQKVLLELVKSHAMSVQTLFTPLPTYHMDAIKFFEGLEMPSLKMLMFTTYCSYDNCLDVVVGLRNKFPGRRIRCMGCYRSENFDD